jgi:hypothetical protein
MHRATLRGTIHYKAPQNNSRYRHPNTNRRNAFWAALIIRHKNQIFTKSYLKKNFFLGTSYDTYITYAAMYKVLILSGNCRACVCVCVCVCVCGCVCARVCVWGGGGERGCPQHRKFWLQCVTKYPDRHSLGIPHHNDQKTNIFKTINFKLM